MAAPTHVERLSREKWGELQKYNKEQSAKNAYGKGALFTHSKSNTSSGDPEKDKAIEKVLSKIKLEGKPKHPFEFTIRWKWVVTDVCESADYRFLIDKTGVSHGKPWVLHDNTAQDQKYAEFEGKSVFICKLQAEKILQKEKYNLDKINYVLWEEHEEGYLTSKPEGRFYISHKHWEYYLYDTNTSKKAVFVSKGLRGCFNKADEIVRIERSTGQYGNH